jgi:flagellar protein FliS
MKCIESKDICGAHNAIVKAQNIYEYLMDSLDMNFEISKNLYSLYDFILDRLVQANIKKDTEILQQVLTMTRGFYDTWKQAELKSRHS